MLLKKASNTRFASSEGVLGSFCRSRFVLRALVNADDFNYLYNVRNVAARVQCKEKFVNPIMDASFSTRALSVYRIILILRRYLRAFDTDACRIAEVVLFTVQVEKDLYDLPTDNFSLRAIGMTLFASFADVGMGQLMRRSRYAWSKTFTMSPICLTRTLRRRSTLDTSLCSSDTQGYMWKEWAL